MVKGREWQKTKKEATQNRGSNVKRREESQMHQLWISGLTEAQIGDKLKRDPRTVRDHLIPMHKANLRDIIGPCLTNNHLELPNRYDQAPLELYGQDWRLDPITWFYLCTPDLNSESEAYWGGKFAELKKRIEEIKFREHYQNLWDKVETLQKELEKVAGKLSPQHRTTWEGIQQERNGCFRPSRNLEEPKADWKDWIHGYDHQSMEEVMEELRQLVPNLDERFIEFEKLLQQLNDDLI